MIEDLEQVVFVPASLEALILDAKLGGGFLLEGIESNVPQHGEVLWAIVGANARIIFAKSDVQHPVEGIFNLPVRADSVERASSGERCTTDEKAVFQGGFLAGQIAFGAYTGQGLQAIEAIGVAECLEELGAEIVQQ